jgi:hypothetical protein
MGPIIVTEGRVFATILTEYAAFDLPINLPNSLEVGRCAWQFVPDRDCSILRKTARWMQNR